MRLHGSFVRGRLAAATLAGALAALLPAAAPAQVPDLGIDASLHGKPIFPGTDPWNIDISGMPVDPNSANLIISMGLTSPLHPDFGTTYQGKPVGMDYIVVPGNQALVPITFTIPDESDPGPYPIPPNAPIEGGSGSNGDRHVLVIDRDNWKVYETFSTYPVKQKKQTVGWTAYSGALFDLTNDTVRPACWTSADAAGLPIFPGLVRYDEVFEQGVIKHALRFTVVNSRRAYVDPARHYASSNTDQNLPPMGMRIRLKASFDISGFPPECQVILTALKKYGMFLADNGSNLFLSGAHDARWNDTNLHRLTSVHASDFEVVQMGAIVTTCP
jgi:hypothetical protein